MRKVYIALGSNQNDPLERLKEAKNKLIESGLKFIEESSIYETEAWGLKDQKNFLNQVIKIETLRYPFDLIKDLLNIESEMGRKRDIRWGSRTIDLDILFYEDWVLKCPKLTIPHPKIQERNFVLVPLNEIAPNFIHPIYLKPIHELLQESNDNSWVKKIN